MAKYRYKKSLRTGKIRKKKIFLKILSFLFSFAAICGLFYFAFFSDYFQLKKITISGNNKINPEEIKNIIKAESLKNLAFFQTNSVLFLGKEKIKNALKETYPQIKDAYLKVRFPDIVEAQIKERQPIATFCQKTECFLIDEEGIVFEKIENDKNALNPIIKTENQDSQIKLGNICVQTNILNAVMEIENYLQENMEIETKEYLYSESSRQITVIVKENWEIYFNSQKDTFEQLSDLKIILGIEIKPENWKKLDYINLKFEGKIYYKFISD